MTAGSNDYNLIQSDTEDSYWKAKSAGEQGKDCVTLYPKCPMSLFNMLTHSMPFGMNSI